MVCQHCCCQAKPNEILSSWDVLLHHLSRAGKEDNVCSMLKVTNELRPRKRWRLLKLAPAENLSGLFVWPSDVGDLGWPHRCTEENSRNIWNGQWEWRIKVGWLISVAACKSETVCCLRTKKVFFRKACLQVEISGLLCLGVCSALCINLILLK